ncbi:NAD kinase [Betaproteobacteria bacterium SCN1]|jgi:NAD+ kinase|nr:NAD kinase [Betaproteobacteria bacterium SCN1]MBN8760413.1 NAD kinase [Thiobacillus sp.]ODU90128.1 MAG: NAD kinase [Thiobacillus sp. SCN 65-179]OJW40097.1 MAG: NAD kinase [Thiobacillus sp. 65-69]
MQTPFHIVGLVGKYDNPGMHDSVCKLGEFLRGRGHEVVLASQTAERLNIRDCPHRNLHELAEESDVVAVLGGDGTMLSIARELASTGTPLIGINQGRLGFLTDITVEDMYGAMAEILSGQYVAEERILLNGQIRRNGERVFEGTAFNDVVVGKGGSGRLIDLEIAINSEFVYSQRADGLVVTSPTGTTAYALSAGGPIVHPTLEAVALVPICPHTLSARPIVVSSHSRIELTLTYADDARVHFDGQHHFDLMSGDHVWITRANRPVTLLHPHSYSYYDTLRQKLHWGKKL